MLFYEPVTMGMAGWSEWADSLAGICQGYQRPSGAYGMTTNEELCFLENYARYSYTGRGQIVDLGCWLGATTLCLARGLVDNPYYKNCPAIVAIDRFVWEDWMTPIAAWAGVPKAYQVGETFVEDVRTLLRDYKPSVQIREEDLTHRHEFPSDIEFLFIDAMKSWDLAGAISHTFFPRLIPGVSLVVQQDFGYHDPIVATNHLLMWQLREHFKCVYCVPRSSSVVYSHTKKISLCDLPEPSPDAITLEMIHEAWEYSLRSVTVDMRPAVLMCKLLFLLERGETEAAEAAGERVVAEGAPVSNDSLRQAQEMIGSRLASAAPGSAPAGSLSKLADLVLKLGQRGGH
jgi:hypothetical protein